MGNPICPFMLLVPSTNTYFLLIILQIPLQVLAHGLFHTHIHHGIPTNVTKHLSFPNFIQNPTTNHIKLLGSAIISQDKGFIQIPDPSPTLNHSYQSGRAIFSSPIRLFEPLTLAPASFNTTFSFHFTTNKELVTTKPSTGGNGLAFLIVPDEFTVGRPGPWLGILNDACDHYKVLAIEFDTTHDPEVGDPNDDHVGINLGSVVSYKVANLSQANVSLHDHLVHRAWITYDGYKRWIEVYLGLDGDEIPSEPILSSSLNLAPFLNEYMFVGFSASTGNSAQTHNILSWNFTSSIQSFLHLPSKHICHKTVAHQVSKYSSVSHSNHPSSFLIFVCIVGLVTLASFSLYCSSKTRVERSLDFVFPKKQRPVPPSKPRHFTYFEVCRATHCFSKAEALSSDLRGTVVLYKGTLQNGCHVTIKRFSTKFLSSFRVEWRRIVKRISSITSISHPSLASIRGWCSENREMIIVYDYYPNGSLDGWLSGLGVLPWESRFKIIKDIAEALCFFHSKEIIHGNLKTSSIFLDVNYQAVLGDYEFKLQGHHDSRKFEIIFGKKSDVFGFGMLVLEIVAGRRNVKSDKEMDLLSFAWELHDRGEKLKLLDERLEPYINLEQPVRVLEVGLSCTLSENNGRPSMEEVVQFLNMQKQIPELPVSVNH